MFVEARNALVLGHDGGDFKSSRRVHVGGHDGDGIDRAFGVDERERASDVDLRPRLEGGTFGAAVARKGVGGRLGGGEWLLVLDGGCWGHKKSGNI